MKSTKRHLSILAVVILAGNTLPALAQNTAAMAPAAAPSAAPIPANNPAAPVAASAPTSTPAGPAAAPAPSSNLVAPTAAAATANKSLCPCDFINGFPSISNFKSGGVTCMVKHSLKQEPTVINVKPTYSIMLTAVDYGVGTAPTAAKTFINWLVQEEVLYNTDPSGVVIRMCGDNSKGTQELIHNDAEFQACISDIKKSALSAGITCGSTK